MKIAIVGSTGLIGNGVAEWLRPRYTVLTVARQESADQQADLTDPKSIESLDLTECEALVHCAGIVDEDFAQPDRAFRQATLGMTSLVRHAKACGIRRFAYISSAHVYGPLKGSLDECAASNPLSDYAIAHFASEQILRRSASPEFLSLTVRPCAVFGIPPELNYFRRWALIPFGFPKAAVETGVIKLATHGVQKRNFVGVSDIAAAIDQWLALPHPLPFLTVNPIGKYTMSVRDYAELCARIASSVTGIGCAVAVPGGPDPVPDFFEYRTVHLWNHSSVADLIATTEVFTRILADAVGRTTGAPAHA